MMDLAVDGLEVASADKRLILNVRSLQVQAGTLLGVRGPSGAGKSTLLFALAGLLPKASGRVAWGGDDLLALAEAPRNAFRRENIGMIFQDFLLFEELSGQANADLTALFRPRGKRASIKERARAGLERLAVPKGARTVASFSGGERQRVSIARAMAHDPAILLADEPTASLHRAAADKLVDDMAGLVRSSGKTLIAVSHDTALLDQMDRVITIEDGQLAA